MKNNPVYKREMLVRSRSFRIPLIIMIFNGILAVVALLNMYQSIAQVKVSGSVRYENFLQLYAFVAALEFMLLMFIMPALTSASISGERERHTLELMFTTKIRPVEIVVGKLMSAFSQLMILVVSSLPILMLTFIYGSISSGDLMILLVSYVVGALYCGSLGIFASSLMKRSTFSNVITYGIMLVVCRWNIHAECVPPQDLRDRDQHDGAQFRGDDPEGELWSVGIPSSPESGNHVRGAFGESGGRWRRKLYDHKFPR